MELGQYGLPLAPTLDFSSAQGFKNSNSLRDTHSDKFQRHRYGRDSTSGGLDLERELELWHPGFRALTFRSGMAALETLMQWAWPQFESFSAQSEIYRKTESLFAALNNLSPRDLERLPLSLGDQEKSYSWNKETFVFLEFPSNPHLRFLDLDFSQFPQSERPFVFLDATMSGLGNLTDEFVHTTDAIGYSLTKFIGGHNDLIGGVLFVKPHLYEDLWNLRSRMGNGIGPMEAFLTLRSLKTFPIRFTTQCTNALEVFHGIEALRDDERLEDLFFPGMGSNADQHTLVARTLLSPGSVMSFVVPGDRARLAERMSGLTTLRMAPSFGSTDSLVEICSLMSRPEASNEELEKSGLEPTLVRLSIGLESAKKILADVAKIVG